MNATGKKTLRYFWKESKKYWLLLIALHVCIAVGVIVNDVVIPLYYKDFIDKISMFNGDKLLLFPELFGILIMIMGWYLLSEIFAWRMGGYLNGIYQSRVIKSITNNCFATIHKHSFGFFANSFSGSLVAKVKRMFRAFERVLDIFTWDVFPNFIRVVFSMGVLFFIAPIFAVLLFVWLILFLCGAFIFSRWKIKYDLKNSTLDSQLTGELADTISNAVTVKTFSRYKYECQNFGKITEEKRYWQRFSWNLSMLFNVFAGLTMITAELGAMYYALLLWSNDQISLGTIVLVQTYLFAIMHNMWDIGRVIRDFYHSVAECEEMTKILYLPIDIKDPIKPAVCRINKGHIEFKDVLFKYEDGKTIFKKFNLNIPAGKKIGVVGESGAGKTTLTKLLLRFADINSGKILIDGQSIYDINQSDLRHSISYVPQDPILFHRSLSDNIRYGNIKASDADIRQSAQYAHAHEFIMNTPQKYETFVGERGVKLSGGERQRVAIARAMLENAPIVVLDEATSALDSKAENLIQDALEKLIEGRTTIVIAHRLSTLRKMDEIIVFDKGQIIEQGSHQTLLDNNGKYAELWGHQVGGFIME